LGECVTWLFGIRVIRGLGDWVIGCFGLFEDLLMLGELVILAFERFEDWMVCAIVSLG